MPDATPASVEPTVVGDADKAREAAFEALALASVDAYPNWNGLFTSLMATWSPDGKHILFGSQRDGMPQIYLGDPRKPAAPPVAITSGTERAPWATFTSDGKWILYNRDSGGDENFSFWKVGLDGKNPVELTPGEPLRRFEPRLPLKQPGTIFFAAQKKGEGGFRIYQLDLDGGGPRQVYAQDVSGAFADVTADGKRFIVTQWRNENDTTINELDVATGQTHRVFPPAGQTIGVYSGSYSADGKRFFVSTDDADGNTVILALDVATGKELHRYRDAIPTARLLLRAAPRGERISLLVDAGNHSEVRILDARTLKLVRNVKVPLGEVRLGNWRADGRAFSAVISRADQPPDVFAVDATSGKVTPLRADVRPELAKLPPIVATNENVPAFDGKTVPVNVYRPAGPATDRRAVLVFFHGGPSGSYAVRWSFLARFYTALGYVYVEPNVRGSSGFGRAWMLGDNLEKRADWLRDVEAVNTWARAQPWCDPDRVVVMGGSYGGYTTLMAMTRQPTLWRAGVDMFGIADLFHFMSTAPPTMRAALLNEFGDPDTADGEKLLHAFSPMRDVDQITRPLFVYAGQNDPRVPREQSDKIVGALRARNVSVEYMIAPNEGHSFDRRETKLEILKRTARFLEDALR